MIRILEVGPERAEDVVALIHAAFAARPALDPPSTAMAETAESVGAVLAGHGGLLALNDDSPVGALLFGEHDGLLGLHRVGVLEEVRRLGVASLLAQEAEQVARRRGLRGLVLEARAELPATMAFWARHGYVEADRDGPRVTMVRMLPITLVLPEADDTRYVGEQLAGVLRAGDLLILTGDLGAGKTTLTQGLGTGLGVRGQVTSPTFVIARIHPGPLPLVHVDAYRLHDSAELDDLDLDTDLDLAVTVVEWGTGLAEALAGDRLELTLHRAPDDVRTLRIQARGSRWSAVDLAGELAR